MGKAGLGESQAGIKSAGKNINNLRYADDITLMAESEEKLKSLLMRLKRVKRLACPGKAFLCRENKQGEGLTQMLQAAQWSRLPAQVNKLPIWLTNHCLLG